MKFVLISFLSLLILSCSTPTSTNKSTENKETKEVDAPENKIEIKVHNEGALKNIMHQGDLSAQANLEDHSSDQHLYALGALKDLKGEILILNSKPKIATYKNNQRFIDQSFKHEAALFVYAHVEKWQEIEVPESIQTYEDLEEYIENIATEKGLDTEAPFPFLLEGQMKQIDWHVINWPEGDQEHSHEKHIASGDHGTIENTEVELLGFYSKHHHAIFTHHTTNMHLHFITKDQSLSGHADKLIPGSKILLKLPM